MKIKPAVIRIEMTETEANDLVRAIDDMLSLHSDSDLYDFRALLLKGLDF